jgi:hypothetical protein
VLDLCKEMQEDLLITSDLLERMPDAGKRFVFGPPTVFRVKGGKREVTVHTVERISRTA